MGARLRLDEADARRIIELQLAGIEKVIPAMAQGLTADLDRVTRRLIGLAEKAESDATNIAPDIEPKPASVVPPLPRTAPAAQPVGAPSPLRGKTPRGGWSIPPGALQPQPKVSQHPHAALAQDALEGFSDAFQAMQNEPKQAPGTAPAAPAAPSPAPEAPAAGATRLMDVAPRAQEDLQGLPTPELVRMVFGAGTFNKAAYNILLDRSDDPAAAQAIQDIKNDPRYPKRRA
jgi:hypothetical protein